MNDTLLRWPITKGLLFLFFPILIGNLLQSSYQFVDAYWIGRVSADAVAAVATSGSVSFLIISLGMGFSMAGAIFVSQFMGAGNKKMVNFTAAQALLSSGISALVLTVVGLFATEPILRLLDVEESIFHLAVPYLQVTFLGFLFVFVFQMIQGILRWIGKPHIATYIITGTVILNFILDPMFILGFGPIPKMGPTGAALATLLTQGICAAIGLWVILSNKFGIEIERSQWKIDWSFIKKMFFLGLPSSLEMSVRSVGFIIITGVITSFGIDVVAGYGAGINIFQFIMIPALGFSMAVSTMVGQNLWARQIDRASDVAKTGALLAFFSLEIIGILIYIFAPQLIQLFLDNSPHAQQIGVTFLKIVAFGFGFMGIQFGFTGVFRSTGNTVLTLFLGILSMFGIQIPLIFLFKALGMNVEGVWITFLLTNIIMALITYGIFYHGWWKDKRLLDEK